MFTFRRFWVWTATAMYAGLCVFTVINRDDLMEKYGYPLMLAFALVLLPVAWCSLDERNENRRQQNEMMLDSPNPVPVRKRGLGIGSFLAHAFMTLMIWCFLFVMLLALGLQFVKWLSQWWFVSVPVLVIAAGLVGWWMWSDLQTQANVAAQELQRGSRRGRSGRGSA